MNTNLLTQEMINKFNSLCESRRKNTELLYNRLLHNHLVQDLIAELSEGADE